MAKKAYEEKNISNIAIAIREKTGSEKTYKPSEMPSGINEVFDKGLEQGYNDGYSKGYEEADSKNLMQYVKGYDGIFANAQFPENTELEFTMNSGHHTNLASFFSGAKGLKSIKLIGGDNVVCTCTGILGSLNDTETIDISELNIKLGGCINFFLNCFKLKTVIGEIDLSSCTNTINFFTNCKVLEEVRLKQGSLSIALSVSYSSNLTAKSIQSIIDGLADLTGQTAQTVSWHSTVLDKLTNEQCAQMDNKNWLYA